MRTLRVVLHIGIALFLTCPALSADEVPPIELPKRLIPYSDVDNVVDTATGVLKLLGTAKFDETARDSVLGQAPCNTPEIAAFYRGMTLVQAAYFIFINKMERGFVSVDSPHVMLGEGFALVPTSFGALVKPGRELLVSVWHHDKLRGLMALLSAVGKNPPAVNADLAAYFTVLQEFADRYEALKRRASRDLAKLNRRTTALYRYERAEKIEYAKETERSLVELEYPKHVFYEAYAKEMRTLLDANRDIGQQSVSACLDGGHFAAAHFGSNGELSYQPYGLYPTSYMIGFWQRRDRGNNQACALCYRQATGRTKA